MRGCTLQNTRTSPAWEKVRLFASPRPYSPRSKLSESLTEKTLWLNGSLFGKVTVEPRGTASTCGAYVLSVIPIWKASGRTGPPAPPIPSSQITAPPRSGVGLLPFSRMVRCPVTRPPSGAWLVTSVIAASSASWCIVAPRLCCVRGGSAYCNLTSLARRGRDTSGRSRRLDPLQVLHEIFFLLLGEAQRKQALVMIHHVEEGREPPVVVEAAPLMRPESGQRCGAIHVRRRAIRLEGVDAAFARRVEAVPRLGIERRDM